MSEMIKCKWCNGLGERAIRVPGSDSAAEAELSPEEREILSKRYVREWTRVASVTIKYVFRECGACGGTGHSGFLVDPTDGGG